MKFNNGYWLLKDGVTSRYAQQVYDVRKDDSSASIAVLTKPIKHRGSVLNTPTVTVELTSPREDVIRVRANHFIRTEEPQVQFQVTEHPSKVSITQDDEQLRFTAGGLTAAADLGEQWALTFEGAGKKLTSSSIKGLGSLSVAPGSPAVTAEHGAGEYMVEHLTLPVGANVYGFGERFSSFVKNGQVVDIWNEDGGTASEQAYKSVPFFVTDAGYGIFVNTPAKVSFEVASEVVSAIQFAVEGEELEYFVIFGPTPADILRKYTDLLGKPALPPRWSFGLWLSTSFTTDYDEATVNSFVQGMRDRDIPLSVLHLDCYWMKGLQWCDFEWDNEVFPDPEGMLARYAEQGLRRSVWINSYIGQRSPLFLEAAKAGYLLRRLDGSVWQWDLWQAGMGIVDFTNPAAREWFAGKIERLLEQGVDAIKTDFGERIPTDVQWFDGSDPKLMHNYYTQIYNQVVFEAIEKVKGKGEAVLFARSATAGGQQFPVHWGGDCESTYQAMAESMRAGLSLGMSGFGFWSHDIGGFEGTPDPTLFKRWVQFGLLSSHSRLHGSTSYRVPWAFDEESVDITRAFVKLKLSLMPYVWANAVTAHRDGLPVMRSMVLEFPEDKAVASLERQYMFGSDLLVAPVFSEDGAVDYYVPSGIWTNYFTGEAIEGGRWHNGVYDVSTLPLLVRPGAVVVKGSRDDTPDYQDVISPELQVFQLAEGESTAVSLYDAQGELAASFVVSRNAEGVSATVAEGIDNLVEGWTLRWVEGPLGESRGPSVSVPAGSSTATVQVKN